MRNGNDQRWKKERVKRNRHWWLVGLSARCVWLCSPIQILQPFPTCLFDFTFSDWVVRESITIIHYPTTHVPISYQYTPHFSIYSNYIIFLLHFFLQPILPSYYILLLIYLLILIIIPIMWTKIKCLIWWTWTSTHFYLI